MTHRWLTNLLLSRVLNAPLVEEVLVQKGKTLFYGGHELPPADRDAVISGARALKEMMVYQLLLRELRRLGQERIGAKSTSWEDVSFGKACLYIADVLDRKVQALSRIE